MEANSLSQFSSFLQPVIGKGQHNGGIRTQQIEGKTLDMKVNTHNNSIHLYNSIKEFVNNESYMVAVYIAPVGSLLNIEGNIIETKSLTPIIVLMTKEQANVADTNTFSLQKGGSFTSVSVANLFTTCFNPCTVTFNEYELEDGSTKLVDGSPVIYEGSRKNSLAFNMVNEFEGKEFVKAYVFELISQVPPSPERIRKS